MRENDFRPHLDKLIKNEIKCYHNASKTWLEGTAFLRQAIDDINFKFLVYDSVHWLESLLTLQLA